MERIKNEVLFLRHGFDLNQYRARASSELKALSESAGFRMQAQGGIAVIPVRGPINRGEGYYGETDLNDIVANCMRAAADASISSVVMKFDTPGGTASGCAMAHSAISALAAIKPVVAHCDMCCSAGMYLASAASKIYATPDAMIGSIGTTTTIFDTSKMYENMGITVHNVDTGEFKCVGAEGRPVTPKDLEYIQGLVTDLFDGFVKCVASGRNISQKSVRDFEARIFVGQKAMDAGLVDGICSMNECVQSAAKLGAKKMGKTNAMASNKLRVAAFGMKNI